MASIYATTWEGRRFRPEEYALKKKTTFRSHLFCPLLPLSCSCFCWSLTRPLPRKSQGAPVKRSWKQLGRKVLGAASFVRNIETPGSLQNVGHLAMIQNIHQITNKFMSSLISYGMTPATLICNAGTLVLIWWKRMDRVIIPFWVDRQFQTETGHGPVVSSTPTCVWRNAQVNFVYNNLTWMHTISSPQNTVPTPPCWKKIRPNPPHPPTPSQNRCHASQRGQPCTFQLCIWCQVRIP